uniref:uncharacterized protein LOC122609261 n=1 Tax=Erigeron canadensis TaxID=72917 RepID=UPI001CB92638|nr:uncharacterized protein LOC122609261 [Erigeron canadensis]
MEGSSDRECDTTLNKANAIVQGIMKKIKPTIDGKRRRDTVLRYVRHKVQSIDKSLLVSAYGSWPLRTFLPKSDVDIVVIGNIGLQDIKHVFEEDSEFRNVITHGSGTDAEILRFFVGRMQVDLCVNHDDGLASNLFMEMVNRIFMRNNLFKESILLVKAWSSIEAKILAPGLLTSYSIQVMVMHVLLNLPGKNVTPFEVFKRFLETYSRFDWDKLAMGRRGVIKLYEVNDLQTAYTGHPEFDLLTPCLEYCASETNSGKPPVCKKDGFVKADMNIIDPINRFKNLAYKVTRPRLKKGDYKVNKPDNMRSNEKTRASNDMPGG